MGGSGSGRWNYYQKKLTTDECWTLDVADLPRSMLDGRTSGVLWAVRISKGRSGLPMRYVAECPGEGSTIVLSYYLPGHETEGHDFFEQVRLLSTKPNFGGKRWWFACSLLQLNGKTCNRRVGKLYLPPGESQFACRQCHNLTYRSSQESHRYDGLYSLIAGESSGEVFDAVKELFSYQSRLARSRRRDRTRGLLEAFDKAFG